MAQKRNAARRRHRRRRDTTGIILRLIVFALIAFIIGLVVWFVLHDRDLRSGISALKKEQYEEAIMCFDDSIAEDKNVAECWRGTLTGRSGTNETQSDNTGFTVLRMPADLPGGVRAAPDMAGHGRHKVDTAASRGAVKRVFRRKAES